MKIVNDTQAQNFSLQILLDGILAGNAFSFPLNTGLFYSASFGVWTHNTGVVGSNPTSVPKNTKQRKQSMLLACVPSHLQFHLVTTIDW